MPKEDKMYWCNAPVKKTRYIEFNFEYLSFTGKDIVRYLKTVSTSFIPKYLFGEEGFIDDYYEGIEELDFKYKSLSIYDVNGACLNITPISQNQLNPRRFYTHIRFIEKESPLDINEIMFLTSLPGFIIGNESNYENYILQSIQTVNVYEAKGLSYDPARLIKIDGSITPRIDISKNVGRERFLPGFKFIPAYKIWFGEKSFDILSKDKVLAFPHAINIRQLANGGIEMQLMDDISKMNELHNIEKQKSLIKYLDIDKMEVQSY